MNAKDLITLWGDANNTLHEYACRQWSGLLSDFYKPRWQQFFAGAAQSLERGQSIDFEKFNKEISEWEWKWVNQRKDYPVLTSGKPVETSIQLHKKYRSLVSSAHK